MHITFVVGNSEDKTVILMCAPHAAASTRCASLHNTPALIEQQLMKYTSAYISTRGCIINTLDRHEHSE